MAKTYAAFYLPQEEPVVPVANEKEAQSLASTITGAWNKAYNYVTNLDENDIRNMTRNMNIQGGAYFTQKYAAGALSKIINGEPVTNKTMLDSLFNTYAPALNAGLAQTGFNSLVEMRNAVQAGNNINVPNFIQGFANGLTVIQDLCKEKPSKYGEEIPIDVVEKLEYTYKLLTAEKELDTNNDSAQYISNLQPITVILSAHIKNENAELWSINDTSAKIVDCMAQKKEFIVRFGKSIYENCIFTEFKPIITSIYDMSFTANITLNYNTVAESYSDKKKHIMKQKPIRGGFDQLNNNRLASEVYLGIIT